MLLIWLVMQFLYPSFLWGLVAVVIPIVIHLLQLRRPQRVFFTNTGFIREVELVTIHRRRLQEVLVLLARMLSLFFLVLVFAQPFLFSKKEVEENTVGVVLDNSPSMSAIGKGGQSLADEALSKAQTLGKSYEASTRFKLLSQSGASLTRTAYLTKLAEGHDISRQSAWSNTVGEQQNKRNFDPLYIFSDFQRSARSEQLIKNINTNRHVVLVPQVALPVTNIYVDSVWLNDAFVRTQANTELHIHLRNGGTSTIADCPVKVRLGARQVAAFSVSLKPQETVATVVQVQLSDKQLALGQVITGDSPITFDNTYYFTLQPTATIRVVEIGTEPVAKQAYNTEALFAYSFMKPQQADYAKLQQASLVLVREVTVVTAGLRDALVGVVRRGGSVVVVPPAEAAGQENTTQLLQALGVGGVQWKSVGAGQPVLEEVAMPDLRDFFFRDVFGPQPRQVALPQVAPILSFGRGGTDILRLRDGDSYLAEFKSGVGKTYVFTAPFAAKYGNFTTQSLFVPVLYRLAILSYQTSQQPAYRLATPVVNLELPLSTTQGQQRELVFRLVKDILTFIPVQRVRGTSLQLELPADMNQAGFYELQREGKVVSTLAFNQDPHESELAAYSVAELRQLVGTNHPNVQVLDDTASPEALVRYRAEQTGQSLWRYCLMLALVCLLAEALLLRFGKPRVPARLVAAG
jgi:hypothetical protein